MESLLALPWDDPALRAGEDLARSVVDYSLDPAGGDPNRFVRWEIVDDGTAFKRISVVAGTRRSVLGESEARVDTYRRRTETEN